MFEYPNTNFHELNLDWIIGEIMKLRKEYDEFKIVNKISFGGAWDITKNYAEYTIVDLDGNGYISIKPVPAGVPIDNEDYWRLVANYSALYADFQNRIIALESKTANMFTINLKDFGALCDGIHDDSEYLQTAIDYCSVNKNYRLLLTGTILIKNKIVLKDNVYIIGNNCDINIDKDLNDTAFTIVNVNDISIDGLNIKYDGTNDFNCIYVKDITNVTIANCVFDGFVGRAVYGDAVLNNLYIDNCIGINCDKIARLNGGGIFNFGKTGNVVNTVTITNCKAINGGNAGFQLFDMKHCVVTNCYVENMTGSGGNWETGNGFNIDTNVIVSNCRVTNTSNAGYYINGGNNLIEGCTVIGAQGFAVDLYTGGNTAYYNTIDGCNFINCATMAHTDLYPEVKVIGGTKQFALTISDVTINGGGTSAAPVHAIEFDELNNSVIDNVNIANVANLTTGLKVRGSQSNNSIRNCALQARLEIDVFNDSSEIHHCKPLNRAVNDLTGFINSSWTNRTGHDIYMYIRGGSITEIALNNVIVASTPGCYFVPNGFILGINGSSAPTLKYIYAN